MISPTLRWPSAQYSARLRAVHLVASQAAGLPTRHRGLPGRRLLPDCRGDRDAVLALRDEAVERAAWRRLDGGRRQSSLPNDLARLRNVLSPARLRGTASCGSALSSATSSPQSGRRSFQALQRRHVAIDAMIDSRAARHATGSMRSHPQPPALRSIAHLGAPDQPALPPCHDLVAQPGCGSLICARDHVGAGRSQASDARQHVWIDLVQGVSEVW